MRNPPSVPESFPDGAKAIELAHFASVAPSKLIEAVSPMNDPLAGPRRRLLRGVATLPLLKNHHLRRSETRGLVKLMDLTGLWTRFEVARVGNETTVPWKTFGFPQVLGRTSKSPHVGHAPTAPTARDFLERSFPTRRS